MLRELLNADFHISHTDFSHLINFIGETRDHNGNKHGKVFHVAVVTPGEEHKDAAVSLSHEGGLITAVFDNELNVLFEVRDAVAGDHLGETLGCTRFLGRLS